MDEEIAAGRFSTAFGPDLLPGMYQHANWCSPKPHSTDFIWSPNHSAGKFALNNYIIKADSTSVLTAYRTLVPPACCSGPRRTCTSMVIQISMSATYRQIPMHPLWQLKQINTFQGLRHVDCNMTFGSCSVPKIWCSFFGLVIWIVIYIFLCADLLHYMDDAWSYETELALVYYSPYDTFYPCKQVKLMQLYDYLGLPHAKKKQVFQAGARKSLACTLILQLMTITMPAMARDSLISAIRAFVDTAISRRCSLLDWQCILGGSIGVNAFPLLRPALQSAYSKSPEKMSHMLKFISIVLSFVISPGWQTQLQYRTEFTCWMLSRDKSRCGSDHLLRHFFAGLGFVAPAMKQDFYGATAY